MKKITVEPTRDKSHGDFATNLAFILSRKVKKPSRELATSLQLSLPEFAEFCSVEVAEEDLLTSFRG